MNSLENFVNSLHGPHLDNARQVYSAYPIGERSPKEISPLTNFVFEFFIYNSLYAVDWEASETVGHIVYHSRNDGPRETRMQSDLERFCRDKVKQDFLCMEDAFSPLVGLDDLTGTWTRIDPDERLSETDGQRFFAKISELSQRIVAGDFQPTKKNFELIADCRYFVYGVRNNIFHGSKSLGQIYDKSQIRRIGVYDIFLRCLNSLFFHVMGRTELGSHFAQLPIVQRWGETSIQLSVQSVYNLLRRGLLKPEDTVLHWKLFRDIEDSVVISATRKKALFYPSAGKDFLFPLLIGMPFCTEFLFFDETACERHWQSLQFAISKIPGCSRVRRLIKETESQDSIEFEFDGVQRYASIAKQDNLSFFDRNVVISFFFHRGDSWGEGGSGQMWDSELLPRVLAKSDPTDGCRLLTDGMPGGLQDDVARNCRRISLPISHRGRDYYYGVVRQP